MKNPEIGEKFLVLGTVVGVYGDESMDLAHRNATIVLGDGQTIQTNLTNLLDPQIVVKSATGQHAVDASHIETTPAVEAPSNVAPPAPATVQISASDSAGQHDKA